MTIAPPSPPTVSSISTLLHENLDNVLSHLNSSLLATEDTMYAMRFCTAVDSLARIVTKHLRKEAVGRDKLLVDLKDGGGDDTIVHKAERTEGIVSVLLDEVSLSCAVRKKGTPISAAPPRTPTCFVLGHDSKDSLDHLDSKESFFANTSRTRGGRSATTATALRGVIGCCGRSIP